MMTRGESKISIKRKSQIDDTTDIVDLVNLQFRSIPESFVPFSVHTVYHQSMVFIFPIGISITQTQQIRPSSTCYIM
jgi:hypothetical protein